MSLIRMLPEKNITDERRRDFEEERHVGTSEEM